MSQAAPVEAPAEAAAAPPRGPRRWRWSSHAANMLLSALALLAIAGLLSRFGALTPAGRALVVAVVNTQHAGPAGRLQAEGLTGDPFGRFHLRRLRIVDARGAWLDAHDVAADWRPLELLARRVHARTLTVAELDVPRAPVLEARPPRALQDLPVAVRVDAAAARVRTGASLTVAPGDWDASGRLDLLRNYRSAARLDAASRVHRGDHLRFDFDLRALDRLNLTADAEEAAGGAVAGGLGLDAAKPFALHAVLRTDDRGGRLEVGSRSGAVEPLRAQGGWSRAGGADLTAVALLAASHHTDKYVTRIGPEARFRLHAKPPHGDLYDVDAVLEGAFAHLVAHGPFDGRRRRTDGMALEARVDDLTTWFKPPRMGPAHATGVARGTWNDLRIEAHAVAEKLDELDMQVARLEGPVVVTQAKGEWRVVVDGTGEGVGGPGLLGPLMGSKPVAHVDLSRLPDGRVLFRALSVVGRYIRVDAQGDITLFGDLTFKGRFSAPDIVGLRPGAHGALGAEFDAVSKKDSNFWTLSGQGRGERFATGVPDFDKLIGTAPAGTLRGSWTPAGFQFDRIDVAGGVARGTARGTYSTGKMFDLDLDWGIKGPFTIGPLEITGAVVGGGKVTGPLDLPRTDLHAKLSALDLGRLQVVLAGLDVSFLRYKNGELEGAIGVDGPSNYGATSAKAAFRLIEAGVDLRDIVADAGGVRLGGALSLRDGEPSTADLTFVAGPGAFLERGRATGSLKITAAAGAAPGAARVALQLQGRDLQLPDTPVTLRTVELHADGPLDRLPYKVDAESGGVDAVPFRWAGTGVLAKAGTGRELTLDGSGRVRGADLKTLETAHVSFGPDASGARVRLALAGGRLDFDGRITGGAAEATGRLTGVGLAAFNPDYVGTVTGDVSLAGKGRTLSGKLNAALTGARAQDAAKDLALDGRVSAELSGDRLRLTASAVNAQGLKADGRLDLPAEASAQPFRIAVDKTKPMTGEISLDGELRPLWDLVAAGERSASGKVSGRVTVGGTLNDPRLTGGVQLAGGAVTDTATGLTLKNLQGSAEFGSSLVTVRRFNGDDGKGGQVSGEGSVSLARDGGSSLQLALARFRLFDNEYGRATTSGAVTVTRDAAGHAKLSGKLTVDRADITTKAPVTPGVVAMDVVELNAPTRPGFAPDSPSRRAQAAAVALDVAIQAPRGIFVRGRGLDAELSLDAHVGGSTLAPDLTGVARLVRGSYDFSGKKFDFDETGVVRLASKPELIRLDLAAERNENGLDARVRITGTAARPDIRLTSIPVLPQDEILSRVLFGVSASQLSPFEAAQLASAVTALATGGGFDVLGSLRQFAGLDRLALGGGPSGATISGGKYLTDTVYLEITGAGNQRGESQTQNIAVGRTGSSATLEWRVRRNLSLVGQVWTGGDSRLSVRFRGSR